MQKTIVMGLFVLSLALTGCFNKDQANVNVPENKQVSETQSEAQNTGEPERKLSLSEWFEQQDGVKCSIQAPTGAVDSWIYKNKVRIEGVGFDPTNAQEIGHMLSDGDWMYTWAGETGIKFNIKEMSNQVQGADATSKPENWEETVAKWENGAVDYNCEKFELSDEFFALPDGITFSDMSALLNVASSSTEALMNELPADVQDAIKKGAVPAVTE